MTPQSITAGACAIRCTCNAAQCDVRDQNVLEDEMAAWAEAAHRALEDWSKENEF